MSNLFINNIINIKRKTERNNKNIPVRSNTRFRLETRNKNSGKNNQRLNHVKKNPRKASKSIRLTDLKHHRLIRNHNNDLRIKTKRHN